jgi:hypothetical protein
MVGAVGEKTKKAGERFAPRLFDEGGCYSVIWIRPELVAAFVPLRKKPDAI